MELPSLLRLAGITMALLGLVVLIFRRRDRVLGRLELFSALALAGVALVGVFPSLVDILPRLTGFTGSLSRITSLMAFGLVFLFGLVIFLQARLDELHFKFYEFLRRSAVDAALERLLAQGQSLPTPSELPLVLLMPAFNEAENLELLLPRAPQQVLGLPLRIIVVDDGSTDNTVDVARKHGALVVKNPVNAGGGHALKVGFLMAQRLGVRFVVTLDADGQHRFEDLPALVQPLLSAGADVVVGSRHLGESIGHEAVRAIGLRLFNLVLSVVVGRRVTDCSSGYRAFNMAQFSRLKLIQQRHHTAELIIEASRRGLRCVEAPITILPRAHGESKKGTNWIYGLRFANTILSTWWRR